MDTSEILILLGLMALGYAVYSKFFGEKSDDSNPEPTNTSEAPKKEKSDMTYGPIKIFYGSQSGTATKFAGILEDEATENDFEPQVIGVEDYEVEIALNDPCVAIFLMATHGEGEPTDNATAFYKWCKDDERESDCLNRMRFTVFGLGNTQYEHYNVMGKNTNKFLEKFGAERIYEYGEGDDNSSLEDDFNDWKENLWAKLREQIQPKKVSAEGRRLSRQFSLTSQSSQIHSQEVDIKAVKIEEGVQYDFQTDKFLRASLATVKDIREIRQNVNDGSTLHMELDLGENGIKYKTAQNLGIFVKNDEKLVNEVADYLGVNLKKLIQTPDNAKNCYFPGPMSVFNVLSYFADFQGQLMKKTLKDLAKLSNDEAVKEKFERMASAKGKAEFKEEIENNKQTFFGLIQKYNIKMTLDQFLIMTPRLAPRVFTISSSNLLYGNVVHVTDSLLVDDLPNGQQKVGVCSQYFKTIYEQFKNGDKNIQVRVDFRESSFKLPLDNTPVMMVGAGTGVAPFIGFAQDKQHLIKQGENKVGELTLYFGCKHEDGDYIFREEINQFCEEKVINNLVTAFSRDSDKKVYVQHRVLENADKVYELLFTNKGTLFICGSMSMGKSVIESVEKIIAEKQNISLEESVKFVTQMENDKKIIKELW